MKVFKKVFKHLHYWYVIKPITWLKIKVYNLKPAQKKLLVTFDKSRYEKVDLIVIAFNNEKVIELQIMRLSKYFKDPYELIIVDNSNDETKASVILDICVRNKTGYIRLPMQNKFKISASHALALNWAYRNVIKKRQPKYFGFLDHDVFPIKPVGIKQHLEKQKFYGLKHYAISSSNPNIWDRNTPAFWYLWPGFSFYNFNEIKNIRNIDFLPLHIHDSFFDTGGANWLSLYSLENTANLAFAQWEREQCADGDIVDIIDRAWVHTMNGSDWRKLNKRATFIEEVLLEFSSKIN